MRPRPGVAANDAVTVAQLQAAVAAMASGSTSAAAAVPVAPEPPTVSVVPVNVNHVRPAGGDTQRRLAQLEALVKQQQQRIAQLESRIAVAAK